MRQLVITILALAALSSCTLNDELERAADGEIQVFAGVEDSRTKAPMDAGTGLPGASFVLKTSTSEPANNFSGGTVYTGDVAATTGRVTFAKAPTYPIQTNISAYLVAYFPGKPLTGDIVEWDIDGTTDILVTNAIWNAGKSSAPNTGATGTKLTFNHQLSRVEVVLEAEAGMPLGSVQDAWGAIQTIEFVDAPGKIKYDLTAGHYPTVTASGTADFALLKDYTGTRFPATAIPANGNTKVNAVAMLAPVAKNGSRAFTLRVTGSGGSAGTPVTVEIPVTLDNASPMMAGYTHTVKLTFRAANKQIEVTTSTLDYWLSGDGGDHNVEFPELNPPATIEVGKGGFSVVKGMFGSLEYTVPAPTTATYNQAVYGTTWWMVPDALVNEPPFTRFEVATANEPNTETSDVLSFTDAWAACKRKEPAGSWRLPRISELMLIYLNREALERTARFTPFGVTKEADQYEHGNSYMYYSGTGAIQDWSTYWLIRFSNNDGGIDNGNSDHESGGIPVFARCVREIP